MASYREFDVVLLGPTGYTGSLCAKHIVEHLPVNLKWALAGRSAGKLQTIRRNLEELNSDRLEPGMFTGYIIFENAH